MPRTPRTGDIALGPEEIIQRKKRERNLKIVADLLLGLKHDPEKYIFGATLEQLCAAMIAFHSLSADSAEQLQLLATRHQQPIDNLKILMLQMPQLISLRQAEEKAERDLAYHEAVYDQIRDILGSLLHPES